MFSKQRWWNPTSKKSEIAVIYSPSFGTAWSLGQAALMFDSELVRPLLTKDFALLKTVLDRKYPNHYQGDLERLKVKWLPEGTRFYIEDYDGCETIHIISPDFGFVA